MVVAHTIASISRAVLDLFYPPVCPGCGRDVAEEADLVCCDCWHDLDYLTGPFCRTCGYPVQGPLSIQECDQCPVPAPVYDKCRAAVAYNDTMRGIIHAYKFDGRKRLSKPLSKLLLWGYSKYYSSEIFDAVVPVPLHPSRLREREFNQATEMLRHLERDAGMTVNENVIRRTRPTQPQSTLQGKERFANVAGAFEVVAPEIVRNRRILVVDDIITTGNTVSEIARVLKDAGASDVAVLAVCRATAGTAATAVGV